jgi:hypothetical protein
MRRSGLVVAVLAGLTALSGLPAVAGAVAPPASLPQPRPWLSEIGAPEATPAPTRRPNTLPRVGQGAPTNRTTYDMTATYDVDATIDWDTRGVKVDTRIDIENTSGGPVGRLMLNTVAPAIGQMRLGKVTVDGQAVTPRVSGQTIIVTLPDTLVEGGTTRVRVRYTGRAGLSTAGHDWMWVKDNDILNLYRFIPWLSRKLPFQRDNHGDPFVTPTSPYVRVRLTADRNLTYATSGARIAVDGRTQTFEARNVRDFNITASPRYKVLSKRTKDGDTLIRVFTINGRADLLMRSALRAFKAYEAWIGEYPWPTFNVAESAGGYAMESPGLIWMPMEKFTDADVVYITAHETGHQWFYGAVGNDQATDMFADEAMTDFISRRLVNRLRSSYCADDRFDKTLYQYSGACYFEVIYVQGSRFIDQIRKRVGDGPFWAAVRQYYADNLFGVSSNKTLLEALREPAGSWALRRYKTRFPTLYGE